jgi:hypothetical protein
MNPGVWEGRYYKNNVLITSTTITIVSDTWIKVERVTPNEEVSYPGTYKVKITFCIDESSIADDKCFNVWVKQLNSEGTLVRCYAEYSNKNCVVIDTPTTLSFERTISSYTTQPEKIVAVLVRPYLGSTLGDIAESTPLEVVPVAVVPVPDPCAGIVCDPVCIGLDRYSQKCVNGVCVTDALIEANSAQCGYVAPICTEGEKRYPTTCWDGSTIHMQVCRNNAWVLSGEKCPIETPHGEKRNPTTCWDNSVIYAEKYDATLHIWIPTGEVCPIEPPAPVTSPTPPFTPPPGVLPPLLPLPPVTPPTPPPGLPGAVMPPGAVGGMISDSGYVYAILMEHWNQHTPWNGHRGLMRYEMFCYPNDTEWVTDKYGRMIKPVTITDRHVYSPIAPNNTHSFEFVSKFTGKTYRVTGTIVPQIWDAANRIQPGGVEWNWTAPPECTLTDADYFTCPDGTKIQLNECVNGVKVPIIPIPTCPPPAPPPVPVAPAPPKLCTEGETRSPITCWDGSQINAEICTKDEFGGTAWLPSGEACPMRAITRVMDMAIPAIMYEGQVVDIVVQVFCGAAASSNEPTTLQVDSVAVQTKNTLAGNVTFRWTAKGVGMHKVCAVIPINPNCAVPGTTCKTITVSAHVEGIMEQIKAEKTAYESQLEYLRGLKKQLKARPTYGAIPGSVFVPPSFAGRIIDVGGIIRTVPPGGISIPVPPGSNIVTIIGDAGERINVPVTVNPGLTVTLPTIPGLPGLPGGF